MANHRIRRAGALALICCAACESRTIEPVEVATVEIQPSSFEIVEGESKSARAIPHGPGGEVLEGRNMTWSTSRKAVVTVDSAGNLAAVGAGEALVRATIEGVTGSAPVTVLQGPTVALAEAGVPLNAYVGGDSETHSVAVTNSGNGQLSGLYLSVAYREGDPTGWLTAGLGGTTAPTELSLAASAAALTVGGYRATVTVASALNGGTSHNVTVVLHVVLRPPIIELETDAVSFSGVVGGQVPAAQEVAVTNSGDHAVTGLSTAITYEGSGTNWLQATLASTRAPTKLRLQASVGLLPAGQYHAVVRVRSAVAANTPQALDVMFEVSPLPAPERGGVVPSAVPPAGDEASLPHEAHRR